MSAKPQKRLVGWTQYLGTQCTLWLGNVVGVVFSCGGFFAVVIAVTCLMSGVVLRSLGYCMISAVLAALGAAGIWIGSIINRKIGKIAPVAPITRHNTGHLPEVETLVRGSDLPPSEQQAELLRAAPQGSETPANELLRATTQGQRT